MKKLIFTAAAALEVCAADKPIHALLHFLCGLVALGYVVAGFPGEELVLLVDAFRLCVILKRCVAGIDFSIAFFCFFCYTVIGR